MRQGNFQELILRVRQRVDWGTPQVINYPIYDPTTLGELHGAQHNGAMPLSVRLRTGNRQRADRKSCHECAG